MKLVILGLSYSVALCLLLNTNRVTAQIEADNNLPNLSEVTRNGNNFQINGGTVRENNLFHSFNKFNVPTGGEAFFNNINSIQNIFTRVTGNSISNIDGIIKANGSANLFFMNPNGIIFGEHASLNIGGSFFATTAENIKFTEGEFSAINPQAPPLLKVNLPLGLQMGNNPEKITVNRNGSSVTANIKNLPIARTSPQTQLKVKTGNTLALIAGDIDVNGGILESQGGNIELASIGSGTVNIINIVNTNKSSQLSSKWNFDYQNISDFKDIKLQRALINTSGGINLQGKNITLNNGSQILSQNYGFQPAGNIKVNASQYLQLEGISQDKVVNSSIIGEAFTPVNGANIAIETKRLEVLSGAVIETRGYVGKGGNIDVKSDLSLQIKGVSQLNSEFVSGINTATVSSLKSGNIVISTDNLSVEDGANLATVTFATGNGGDIHIDADNVKLTGFSAAANQPSLLSASTLSSGNAGNLKINASKLEISGGASINTSTLASGDAGYIAIDARDSVKITDTITENFGSAIRSHISSSATVLPEQVRIFFNLFSLASGKAGDIRINTPKLNIDNGGEVSVTNEGTGDAGSLYISADYLKLNQQSSIGAATANGKGGDISLNTRNLQLRNDSAITATASGNGDGGNIKINTDTLVALENSDITANAQNSFGGRIIINSQGVFGIQEREEITRESDITASSQLGASFSGTVELNTPNIDPNKGVNQLPKNIIDNQNQIASGCGAKTGNTFVATGRGGIPQNPSDRLKHNTTWYDIRGLSVRPQQSDNIARTTVISKQRRIIEATGFEINQFGQVELVAKTTENSQQWQPIVNCGEV
ncbi:filamentous hemagglutinin-like protein [Calothrix parasitica NIES-267]|uniref:Filamentous hemagglutinin-like protein n=1 Tax=Calothrix parasitica NIES-267 TaxID=1973488 RepID=A0A1Z4LJ07_9CYAN|nr:filamentous hemagglutinin-like protein [Calothrix parasitica NIES-267]